MPVPIVASRRTTTSSVLATAAFGVLADDNNAPVCETRDFGIPVTEAQEHKANAGEVADSGVEEAGPKFDENQMKNFFEMLMAMQQQTQKRKLSIEDFKYVAMYDGALKGLKDLQEEFVKSSRPHQFVAAVLNPEEYVEESKEIADHIAEGGDVCTSDVATMLNKLTNNFKETLSTTIVDECRKPTQELQIKDLEAREFSRALQLSASALEPLREKIVGMLQQVDEESRNFLAASSESVAALKERLDEHEREMAAQQKGGNSNNMMDFLSGMGNQSDDNEEDVNDIDNADADVEAEDLSEISAQSELSNVSTVSTVSAVATSGSDKEGLATYNQAAPTPA